MRHAPITRGHLDVRQDARRFWWDLTAQTARDPAVRLTRAGQGEPHHAATERKQGIPAFAGMTDGG